MLTLFSDPSPRTDIRAYRLMIGLGAVAIPGFWVLDRVEGWVYDDPFGYRIAICGLCLILLALTYLDDRVRDNVRVVGVSLIFVIAAFFSRTAAKNGLDAAWV
ncbi:MAG: hypothetical protein HKN04_14000, partial [Rhodothermaceae bacterium]|nr:hypothetical protein [Rhodothermaceae bacterium]